MRAANCTTPVLGKPFAAHTPCVPLLPSNTPAFFPKAPLAHRPFKTFVPSSPFQQYALHTYVTSKKDCFFSRLLDANTRQTVATRASRAVNDHVLGLRGRPRFKKRRHFSSLEGKTNQSGLRFRDGLFSWMGLSIPVFKDEDDPVVLYALSKRVKYVRLVKRFLRGQTRFFIQLVLDGRPYKKRPTCLGQGVVGLDLGPSSLAAVGQGCALLDELAPRVQDRQQEVRRLQRKLDRQRRACNRENYHPDGTKRKAPRGGRPPNG